MRARVPVGLYLSPIVWVIAATFSGRLRLSLDERAFGVPVWETLLGGLVADVAILALPFVVLLAPLIYVATQQKKTRPVLFAVGGLLVVALWLLSVSATETKSQLGFYPTYREIARALGSHEFTSSSWKITLGERYRMGNYIGIALLVVVGWWWRALDADFRTRTQLAVVAGVGLVGGGLVAVAPALLPHIAHPRVLYPPATTLVRSLVPIAKTSQFSGLRAAFAARIASPTAPSPIVRHALDEPLAPPFATLTPIAPARPIVWHIVLESFRGDDIAALNPSAPAALLPTLESLYGDRRSGAAVGFVNVYQSGMRSAQSLGAVTCGFGVLPFNASIVRDLGHLPLRCVSDVFADAAITPTVVYAGELSFDSMLEFFRAHHMATVESNAFPLSAPRGTWGAIGDGAVYDEALRRAALDAGAQYNLVLTLANHVPYDAPSDLAPELVARVDQLLAGRKTDERDRARLYTMAYTDAALGRFLDRLEAEPIGERSLVIVHADHATPETFLWSPPTLRSASSVPLVVYRPRRVPLDGLRALRDVALSLDDVPNLLLALVAPTLPAEARWHTLGGAATRGEPIFAVEANAKLLRIDASGTPHDTGERNPPFADESDFDRLGPILARAAAAWHAALR